MQNACRPCIATACSAAQQQPHRHSTSGAMPAQNGQQAWLPAACSLTCSPAPALIHTSSHAQWHTAGIPITTRNKQQPRAHLFTRSSSSSTYSSLSAFWYTATNTRPRPCSQGAARLRCEPRADGSVHKPWLAAHTEHVRRGRLTAARCTASACPALLKRPSRAEPAREANDKPQPGSRTLLRDHLRA